MQITPLNNLKIIKDLGQFSKNNHIELYLVGGCVRDWILKRINKDLDFISNHDCKKIAQYLIKNFGGNYEKFTEFGTYRLVLKNGLKLDFARYRSEKYLKPAVLPEVRSSDKIEEDLKRRDFTINALAMNVLPEKFGKVLDLFGGVQDIKRGIIRVLHKKSFIDDPTRIFRLARYCARFGFKPDTVTEKLIQECVRKNIPSLVSRERIKNELWRILEEKNPENVFRLLKKWKMLKFIHRNFKYNKPVSLKLPPLEQLGLIACGMGRNGIDFLNSLKLERKHFFYLKNIFEIHFKKVSPRKNLPFMALKLLKILNPEVSKSAFKPLFINGFDLIKLGIAPRKKYSDILNKVAKAQWQGKFNSKKQALAWIKKNKNLV